MPTTYQKKEIDAPVIKVWSKLQNFHDFSWAPSIITNVEKIGDHDGKTVGAKRILNNVFHETLVKIDHDNFVLKYSIDDGPSPVSRDEVSNYFGVIKLSPFDDGNKTHIEWSSSWESNVEDAAEFCSNIYAALLNSLYESFRGQ